MPHRPFVATAIIMIAIGASVRTAAAQATRDQARLVVGVSAGYIGGSGLWRVNNQPIRALNNEQDVFDIERRLRPNITFIGQGTYFPSDHVGITGEVAYLGLGTTDACKFIASANDGINRSACAAINGDNRSASGVAATAGVMLRPASRAAYQPYVRIQAGVALVPRSTVPVTAVFGQTQGSVLPIYTISNDKEVKPAGVLAFGISTAPSAGYQFRVEARATAVQLRVVSGPTAFENMQPETRSVTKLLPSITVGLDIVLEKRRGRRY